MIEENIDFKNKVLFVHIPKTAGRSIRNAMFGDIAIRGYHTPISFFNNSIYRSFFKFSIIRNPFDRMVSLYEHFIGTNHSCVRNYKQISIIESKVINVITFKMWIKNYEINLKKNKKFENLTKSQTYWLESEKKINLDYLIRYENIDSDWLFIADKFGYNKKLEKTHQRKNKEKNYKEYYDDETKKMVEEIYKEDLLNFNYDF